MDVTMIAVAILLLGVALVLISMVRTGRALWQRHRGDESTGTVHSVSIVFGVGFMCCVGSQALVYTEQHTQQGLMPLPLWADTAYLSACACALAGVVLLVLPFVRRPGNTRVLLDSLMVTAAVAPFSWYFILGPAVTQPNVEIQAQAVYTAHVICDLLLLLCVVVLSTQISDRTRRRAAVALVSALSVIVLADSAYLYHVLHHTHVADSVIALIRLTGFGPLAFAGGLCASSMAGMVDRSEDPTDHLSRASAHAGTRQLWRYLLPYALIPAVVGLIAYVGRNNAGGNVQTGVYVTAALLIELVFVHQLLAYRELIALASRSARMETLASADPVTGLPNHRHLVTMVDHELRRSERYDRACTLLFMDIDRFKSLNDTFGHPAGDAALREFGSVVRTALRSTDSLGRWGGEEFVAILPETDGAVGLMVAERVRSSVASHSFRAAAGTHITCSIGLASYPADGSGRDAILEMADRALYAAKHLGRNQVREAADPTVHLDESAARTVGSREEAAIVGTVEALAIHSEILPRQCRCYL